MDVFSGGALKKFTIFAMGIVPYINASIIMQLLTFAIPQWQEMSKEGESGRKRIAQYTRYLTVAWRWSRHRLRLLPAPQQRHHQRHPADFADHSDPGRRHRVPDVAR